MKNNTIRPPPPCLAESGALVARRFARVVVGLDSSVAAHIPEVGAVSGIDTAGLLKKMETYLHNRHMLLACLHFESGERADTRGNERADPGCTAKKVK